MLAAGTTRTPSGAPGKGWPTPTDFSDALQNPQTAFLDPELQRCSVEKRRTGVPWARTGAFASVFKLNYPGGGGRAVAVRVFTPIPLSREKEERLTHVAAYLGGLGVSRPSYLVKYGYQPQGIRVKRVTYPIQTMDWVNGVTLGNWYQAKMRANDLAAVRAMAARWQALVLGLRGLRIAHGDLQHGNVMVRDDDTLVLVDYDGMCVPALVRDPPLPCCEFGLKGYVHPGRDAEALGPDLDHFPAWVILIALRASAAKPALFRRFVDDPENENMLFSPADMAAPTGSKLWPELLGSPDPEVRAWAAELRPSLDGPFARIPPFQTDPYSTLLDLCAEPVPDWEKIQVDADRIAATKKALPAAVLSKVATARKKVASRAALRAAITAVKQTGDPRPVAAAFDPAIYADWPKHDGLVKQATRYVAQGKLLTELEAAARTSTDGREFLEVWDRTKAGLADCRLAGPFGARAEAWRSRIEAADEFVAATRATAPTERALAEAWQRVRAAGQPHPSLTAEQRARGEQAVARVAALQDVQKLPARSAPPSETHDRRLVELWGKHEHLLAGCAEASAYWQRAAEAAARLAALAEVADAVRKATAGTGTDAAVVTAAAKLPAGYTYDLRGRVALAREGEERFSGLKTLLDAPSPSDLSLAAEWEKFKSAHPRHAALLDPTRRDRCEQAVRRRNIILDLSRITKEVQDPYQQDRQIKAVWDAGEAELKGSAELPRLGPRIKLALLRLRAWERLGKAVRTQDVVDIRAAFEPTGLTRFAEYPPVVAVRPQIDDLIRLAKWLGDLRAKLGTAGQTTGMPLTPADLENLKRYGPKLDPDTRGSVLRLLRERLWQAVKLAPATAPPQVIPGPVPMARVRWTWTGWRDLVSWFEVATAAGPLAVPAQADRDRIGRCRPDDLARDDGRRSVVLGPGPVVTVTVWPVLDLGWETMHGEPIHIGPIRAGR
jgi:hypothetical protein